MIFLIFLKSSSVRILSISTGIEPSCSRYSTPGILQVASLLLYSPSTSYSSCWLPFPLNFLLSKAGLYYLTKLMTDFAARDTFLFLYSQQVQRQSIISSVIIDGNFLKIQRKVLRPIVMVNSEQRSLTKCYMICLTNVSIQSSGTSSWMLSAKAAKTWCTSFCLGSRYLMRERQKGRRISWWRQMTRAINPMQMSLCAYFQFLALMMLNNFSTNTWGLQMRSMGMKCFVRASISRFLSLRAARFFSFSNCFSLCFVCLTTPFFTVKSEGFTGSSSLSGSYSKGIVVSIRKQQAISRVRLEGPKHASAMMFTVRLSVQTLRLQSSMRSFSDFWAVLSACLGMQPEMKARICWLILLFWWWLFMRRISLSTYLQIMLRNSLSSRRICRNKNSVVLTGSRMFLARRIITLPAHFFLMQECKLAPNSSINFMTALGIQPSISGKYLTDLARKMRSSPKRQFLRMVSPCTFSNSTLKSSRQCWTSFLYKMGSLGILIVRSYSFLKRALSIAFWFYSYTKVEAINYYN